MLMPRFAGTVGQQWARRVEQHGKGNDVFDLDPFAVRHNRRFSPAADRLLWRGSFQFFDRSGHAAFKVFLGFGGSIPPEKAALFAQVLEAFRKE